MDYEKWRGAFKWSWSLIPIHSTELTNTNIPQTWLSCQCTGNKCREEQEKVVEEGVKINRVKDGKEVFDIIGTNGSKEKIMMKQQVATPKEAFRPSAKQKLH